MTVHLVGAGPGDPGLLTLRAAELLSQCDVVVYDRLVDDAILARVPPWAEQIDVGKVPGRRGPTQDDINEILVDRGARFDCVVRLKGGDPHVFGRGAEELAALHAAGIATEVVPGVSAAIAAPAAAGIPVTARFASSGFTVITAHQDPATDRALDWDALARLGTTLVILMGAARARSIAERLIAGGMAPDTPVAVITDATRAHQSITRTVLARLGDEQIRNPSTIVVGAVAALDLRSLVLAVEGSAR
ncbi:MAG TPA: uroporphyrinogen-III C-methyltransferase [Acidimicrobiales bacterium]|jgi:uroporphyrin-III C-methyltransferase|nr:uroporphyrinogen-III C-methyltransferase [Acidimicrobiales bacterium]